MKRLASIDIGTNTILLLIAEIDENKLKKNRIIYKVICDEHRIARLGEGVNQTGVINNEAIKRAISILVDYKKIIAKNITKNINSEDKSKYLRVVSTSAIRDSKNKDEVIKKLSKAIEHKVEMLSGEVEAELSYLGSKETNKSSIIIDIGGGSTEFISGDDSWINYKKSLDIGAVRITEMFFSNYPPTNNEINKANSFIKSQLSNLDLSVLKGDLYAVAGTPTSLTQIKLGLNNFDNEKIHLHKMSLDNLTEIIDILKSSSTHELINNYYVHPKRADVLLAGSLILYEYLKISDFKYFYTSTKGLRYGIILDMCKNNNCR